MHTITTYGLTKYFGSTPAAEDISLQVNQGEIYGFLGLNGAGKTTLIRMILGMIKPDKGSISLFGHPLNPGFTLWNEIGYMVETPFAYPNLSVAENLKVYYLLRQLKKPVLLDDIIDKLRLTKYRETKAKVLSLGNQQRLGLAKALIHRPRLLILDEPINGLDPEGIVEIRELLKRLADLGTTIFLSSHILGEISRIAHRIGIIHHGRLIRELTTSELNAQLIKKVHVVTNDNELALSHLVRDNHQAVLTEDNVLSLSGDGAIAHPEHITQLLTEKNLPPKQVYLHTEDLEMYFLRIIRDS